MELVAKTPQKQIPISYFALIIVSSLTILIVASTFANTLNKDTINKYNETGIKCMKDKDYENAVRAFEKAYKMAPNNTAVKQKLTSAYFSLANECSKQGALLNKSKTCAEKAYNLNTNNEELSKDLSILYSNIGYLEMKKGLTDTACKSFLRATQLDKNNWDAYANMGRLMYEQGKIKEAIKSLSKALELNPNMPEIKEQLKRLKKESQVDDKFKSKYYGHFDVRYDGYEKESLAWKVMDILNEAYNRLGYDFQYYPHQKVAVIIYTKEQFQNMTGMPDWVGGLFDGIIRVTASDIEGEQSQLKNILYHEYVHALLRRKTGNNIPRWLNEGLAQYKEPNGEQMEEREIHYLRSYINDRGVITLDVINQSFNTNQILMAYLEAKLLVQYLVEHYGFYQVRNIVEKLALRKDINIALKEVLYIDSKKLETDWQKWVKDKYKYTQTN